MTNDRQYFATAALAIASLKRQKLKLTETNSPFNYSDDLCTRDAGIRSDVIGFWIEYREYAA
jgi:hypothetical protein